MNRAIKLLGKPEIIENGQSSPLLQQPETVALLAFLIVNDSPYPKKRLIELLWDANLTTESHENLESLLVQIQRSLPELEITTDHVTYKPSAETEVDFLILQKSLKGAHFAETAQALSFYRGGLLHGFILPDATRFNEWLALSRERLWFRVVTTYQTLCYTCQVNEHWAKGIILAMQWSKIDPLDETAQQWLIHFLAKNGHTKVALRQYECFRDRLLATIGDKPHPDTAKLAQNIAATLSGQLFFLFKFIG